MHSRLPVAFFVQRSQGSKALANPKLSEKRRSDIEMPVRIFLYRLDQVAFMLDMPEATLRAKHLYLVGRTAGRRNPHYLVARNVAPPDAVKKDWRIAENELVRWMRVKGFTFARNNELTN